MNWWRQFWELFAQVFLGFLREQGRDEVRKEVQDATDKTHEKWDEIDRRPDEPDPFDGLRRRR